MYSVRHNLLSSLLAPYSAANEAKTPVIPRTRNFTFNTLMADTPETENVVHKREIVETLQIDDETLVVPKFNESIAPHIDYEDQTKGTTTFNFIRINLKVNCESLEISNFLPSLNRILGPCFLFKNDYVCVEGEVDDKMAVFCSFEKATPVHQHSMFIFTYFRHFPAFSNRDLSLKITETLAKGSFETPDFSFLNNHKLIVTMLTPFVYDAECVTTYSRQSRVFINVFEGEIAILLKENNLQTDGYFENYSVVQIIFDSYDVLKWEGNSLFLAPLMLVFSNEEKQRLIKQIESLRVLDYFANYFCSQPPPQDNPLNITDDFPEIDTAPSPMDQLMNIDDSVPGMLDTPLFDAAQVVSLEVSDPLLIKHNSDLRQNEELVTNIDHDPSDFITPAVESQYTMERMDPSPAPAPSTVVDESEIQTPFYDFGTNYRPIESNAQIVPEETPEYNPYETPDVNPYETPYIDQHSNIAVVMEADDTPILELSTEIADNDDLVTPVISSILKRVEKEIKEAVGFNSGQPSMVEYKSMLPLETPVIEQPNIAVDEITPAPVPVVAETLLVDETPVLAEAPMKVETHVIEETPVMDNVMVTPSHPWEDLDDDDLNDLVIGDENDVIEKPITVYRDEDIFKRQPHTPFRQISLDETPTTPDSEVMLDAPCIYMSQLSEIKHFEPQIEEILIDRREDECVFVEDPFASPVTITTCQRKKPVVIVSNVPMGTRRPRRNGQSAVSQNLLFNTPTPVAHNPKYSTINDALIQQRTPAANKHISFNTPIIVTTPDEMTQPDFLTADEM
ncbi:hypothetical protein PCE1_001515 [Barthelona sp. PCE]